MMRHYRWYFLDPAQKISAAEFVPCVDDEDAKRKAVEVLAERRKYRAIEIWDGRRRVSRLDADGYESIA